jgi:hypothetical protein
MRYVGLAALALAVAVLAFTYRFNALGGTLGGFDNDEYIHLMRSTAILHGDQPLRDFRDGELRGAWPSLSYAVPAWAQWMAGENMLAEAYLTVGALTVAYVLTFFLAADLSQRWWVALLAAIGAIATTPKLYNYPKVLMLALGALAVRAVVVKPTWMRLGCAAVVTAIAVLFRHDYGVYVAAAVIAGLAIRDVGAWQVAARGIGRYVGMTAVLLTPSAIWIQRYRGLLTYVRDSLTATNVETSRTQLRLPDVDAASWLSGDGLLTTTYYLFWMIVLGAGILLVVRAARGKSLLTPAERGTAAGLLAMAAMTNLFFLRSNLSQRFGDAVIPVVLLGAWSIGAARGFEPRARRIVTGIAVAALVAITGSAYVYADVGHDFQTSGLSESWEKTMARFGAARDELKALPPSPGSPWPDSVSEGTGRAARYVAECTSPDDYLLVAGYAPEILVMARRRFAAGQPTWGLSFYTSVEDQEAAIARLHTQSVPVVLVPMQGAADDFSDDYPLIARDVAERYRDAGIIEVEGERRIRVFVARDRQPLRVDSQLGLPCFR